VPALARAADRAGCGLACSAAATGSGTADCAAGAAVPAEPPVGAAEVPAEPGSEELPSRGPGAGVPAATGSGEFWFVAALFAADATALTTFACDKTSSPGLLIRMTMITLICWIPVAVATAPAFCVVFADCVLSCAPADPPEAGAGGGSSEAVWDAAAGDRGAESSAAAFLAVPRNAAISRERTSATRNARVAPPPKGRWRNVVEEVFALKKGRDDRKSMGVN